MKKILNSIFITLVSIVTVAGIVYAGSLTPTTNTVGTTQYTLSDIYNKISNLSYSAPTHSVSTTTAPSPSLFTLADIYGRLVSESSLAVPGNIRDGVTILGVRGTFTCSGSPGALEWSTEFTPVKWSTTWNMVNTYCSGTVGGKTGWRLPTIIELQNALTEQIVLGIPHGFSSEFRNYWSTEKSATEAYVVTYDGRSIYPSFCSKTYCGSNLTTRCVR